VVSKELKLLPGYSIVWSGQYEYMERAKARLTYVVPLTLAIIVVLLYMNFGNFAQVAILMGALPLALVGSVWLMYAMDFSFSIAVGVGFIALAGVAVETGVIMLVYLDQAWHRLLNEGQPLTEENLTQAVLHGAGLRVRPVLMTAGATIIGLLPILYGAGTGSEIMSRLAAPMVGGMISSVILTLLVLPVIYLLWRKRQLGFED
jgi:Cu(I)/Ag(I) efflux system membrane protein CusA/SilA